MDFEKFKELLEPQPASIKAKSDADGIAEIEVNGRSPELLALSMQIVKSILERTPFSIDDYCGMYKDGTSNNHSIHEQADEKTEKLIRKILGDM